MYSVGPYIQYENTQLWVAVSVKTRVAITLWVLASSAEYRMVAHLFGVGWSSICEVIHKTCAALVEHLLPKYITSLQLNNSSNTQIVLKVRGVYLNALVLLMALIY